MQENNMDYVPANIVKMLFEQSQNAINANTAAIKEMTGSVNELTKVMAAPPTKQNIMDEIKEHESNCGDRVKETCDMIDEIVREDEEKQKTKKIEVEKQYTSITSMLDNIKTGVNSVLGRVNLMITVVVIVLGVVSIIYFFVTSSVNTSVKQVLDEHIKVENNINKNGTGVPNAIK